MEKIFNRRIRVTFDHPERRVVYNSIPDRAKVYKQTKDTHPLAKENLPIYNTQTRSKKPFSA